MTLPSSCFLYSSCDRARNKCQNEVNKTQLATSFLTIPFDHPSLHWVYLKQKSKTSSNPITVLENVCIRVGEIQIGWGRELQSRGAARKALSPQLFLLGSLSFVEIEEQRLVRVVKEV